MGGRKKEKEKRVPEGNTSRHPRHGPSTGRGWKEVQEKTKKKKGNQEKVGTEKKGGGGGTRRVIQKALS